MKTLPFLCLYYFEEITLEFSRLAENFLIELFSTKTSTCKVVSWGFIVWWRTRGVWKIFFVSMKTVPDKSERDCIHVLYGKAGLQTETQGLVWTCQTKVCERTGSPSSRCEELPSVHRRRSQTFFGLVTQSSSSTWGKKIAWRVQRMSA